MKALKEFSTEPLPQSYYKPASAMRRFSLTPLMGWVSDRSLNVNKRKTCVLPYEPSPNCKKGEGNINFFFHNSYLYFNKIIFCNFFIYDRWNNSSDNVCCLWKVSCQNSPWKSKKKYGLAGLGRLITQIPEEHTTDNLWNYLKRYFFIRYFFFKLYPLKKKPQYFSEYPGLEHYDRIMEVFTAKKQGKRSVLRPLTYFPSAYDIKVKK